MIACRSCPPNGFSAWSLPAGDPDPDPVSVALSKLTSHIGNARKFPKAAGLLRQLLASGSLTAAQHGPAVFAALRAAMADPARVGSFLT